MNDKSKLTTIIPTEPLAFLPESTIACCPIDGIANAKSFAFILIVSA